MNRPRLPYPGSDNMLGMSELAVGKTKIVSRIRSESRPLHMARAKRLIVSAASGPRRWAPRIRLVDSSWARPNHLTRGRLRGRVSEYRKETPGIGAAREGRS